MRSLWRVLDDFFFRIRPNFTLVGMRIGFGLFLIPYFWDLHPVVRMIYGDDGLVSHGARFPYVSTIRPHLFSMISDRSDAVVWAVTLGGMASGVLLAAGILTRIMPAVAWLFVSSVVTTIPGNSGDLLVLCFAALLVPAGALGHLGSGLPGRATVETPVWTVRLFQIQLVLVYFFSGWHKLGFAAWNRGEAMHYVVAQDFWARLDLTWLIQFPALSAALTISVLLFELLLFPVLIWVKPLKLWMLGLGALFHAGIFLTMKVFTFHQIMLLYYLAFLDPDDWRRLVSSWAFLQRKWRNRTRPGRSRPRPV